MTTPPVVRLDKLLGNLGYGSRREVQAMARAGRVMRDGAPIRDGGDRIAMTLAAASRFRVDGEALDPLPGLVLMLNKPLGMTCSHQEAGPLVYDLLPPRWRLRDPPISTIGRLDKETAGLLLLTDNGDLLHKIIAPKAGLAKRYQVDLARPLRGDEGEIFASGSMRLERDEKPLRPAILEIHAPTRVAVTVTEGRYHQIRRMFAALENHVTGLKRDRIGSLAMPDDLDVGRFRILDPVEIAAIFAPEPANVGERPCFG